MGHRCECHLPVSCSGHNLLGHALERTREILHQYTSSPPGDIRPEALGLSGNAEDTIFEVDRVTHIHLVNISLNPTTHMA